MKGKLTHHRRKEKITKNSSTSRNTTLTLRYATLILYRIVDMPEVCSNVTFENVAREIRAKWSGDSDKASLVAAQNVLNQHLAELKVRVMATENCDSEC